MSSILNSKGKNIKFQASTEGQPFDIGDELERIENKENVQSRGNSLRSSQQKVTFQEQRESLRSSRRDKGAFSDESFSSFQEVRHQDHKEEASVNQQQQAMKAFEGLDTSGDPTLAAIDAMFAKEEVALEALQKDHFALLSYLDRLIDQEWKLPDAVLHMGVDQFL